MHQGDVGGGPYRRSGSSKTAAECHKVVVLVVPTALKSSQQDGKLLVANHKAL